MATYYARADGTAANKAAAVGPETDATACMTLTVMAAQTFSADDVIIVSGLGGAYAERLLVPSSGTSGHQLIFRGSNFPVVNGNGTQSLRMSARNYVTIEGITFTGVLSNISAGTGNIINKCVFKSHTSAFGSLLIDTNASLTINNSLFHGNDYYGINATTGSTIVMRNNIVSGNVNYGLRTENGTTLDYDYNLLSGNNLYASTNNSIGTGATDGGHNITDAAPGPVSYKVNTAYFVFTMDDNYDSGISGQGGQEMVDFADALAPYNVPMTLFIRTDGGDGNGPTATLQANLASLKNRGHEIAVHTWSHSLMDRTNAFAVTSTNASPTCDVDAATKTITLATTTPGNTVTLSWTSANQTIGTLQAAVVGKGWTITPSANIQTTLLLNSLADTSGAQAVPYTATLDKTVNGRYYQDEIAYPRTLLAAIIGETPMTYAYPGNVRDAGAEAYLVAQGFYGGRASTNRVLSSLNLYAVATIDLVDQVGDGTEATIRTLAQHMFAYGMNTGQIYPFLIHASSEWTTQQAAWFVDEIQQLGGEWITFKDAVTRIKADHSTADNITYTKTYPDLSNYRLTADSEAIDAGTTVSGLSTDYFGNTVPYGAPDVGINEHNETYVFGKGQLESVSGVTAVTRP